MNYKDALKTMAGILLITGLVGCGSAANTGSPISGDSAGLRFGSGTTAGKVGILIKDDLLAHPSDRSKDMPELSQLWVTINRVSIKMEEADDGDRMSDTEGDMDDDKWLTVFEGTARYDLLTLQDNKSALMSLAPIPAGMNGYYEKARLEIDETPGLNCFYALPDGAADDPLNPCTDSDALLLDVPSGKIDIEFHPPIYLGQGITEYIVFDLLPAQSVKITYTNGEKGYLLRPEVHAYTMSSIMQDNGWDDMDVDEVDGLVYEISGCDNPDIPDTLVLSPEHDGANITIDITGAVIALDDSEDFVTCGSLQPGQDVELKVSLAADGSMTAGRIEIKPSSDSED